MKIIFTSLITLVAVHALFAASTRAQQPPTQGGPSHSDVRSETGPQLSVASGIFLPPEGGRLGFAVSGDARFGVAVGRASIAPGVRVASFLRSGLAAVAAMAATRVSTRLELSLGTTVPYLLGGVGFGHLSEGSRDGFAYQLGAGALVAVGTRVWIGAELTYLGIASSDFRALFLGPCVSLTL